MTVGGRRGLPSMTDVARIAGVSVSTVSHVINQSRPVSARTEQAVRATMIELGYIDEHTIRSLRGERTLTVGLAMSAMKNPYFGDVVQSIERETTAAGYSLMLVDTHDDATTELKVVGSLIERRVDAIVLAPSSDPSPVVEYARDCGIVTVVIDRSVSADVDQVGVENVEATATLVDHLARVGQQDIAMISGLAGLTTTTERIEGFKVGLARNGLAFRPERLVAGHSTAEGAGDALRQLMAAKDRPEAVVVGNNQMTIGVMRATKAAGIAVPTDLRVVAFDDFEWAGLFSPGLTVIAQPITAIASHAVQFALSRLADPDLPPRRLVLKPTFVHRESCGCTP